MNRGTGHCIAFLHAHPDDEAIFTGGTILRAVEAGMRTVVIFATDGAPPGSSLAATREAEARRACDLLGVHRVEFLNYVDSGLRGEMKGDMSFMSAHVLEVAERLAGLLTGAGATALVVYDEGGIYGHPDHIAVHHCGLAAATLAHIDTVYECTVDREYLHFVETHLVGHAVESLLGLEVAATNAAPLGVPTVMVSTTVDVRDHLAGKRAAMAAHVSQIPADHETLTMSMETFAGVYGFEWYVRRGPEGPLEQFAY